MSDPAATALRCESVGKRFVGRDILAGVDLDVEAGALSAILGASGSGKTTLLRLVVGFLRCDEGSVSIHGNVVGDARGRHVAPEHRGVGYVAQEGALFPHLTVGQNIGFGLGRSERRSGERVAATLEMVGLGADYGGRMPHELSGGEQRRVSLARALAPGPGLIVLDEPFTGLDAALRLQTRDAVMSALRQAGATALLVTHDQAEALSMGDTVSVLRDGRLVQTAAPADLYDQPVDLDVARFLGEATVLTGTANGPHAESPLGRVVLRAPMQGQVDLMIRPEQIQLGEGTDATVLGSVYYGRQTLLHLRLRDGSEVIAGVSGGDGAASDASVKVSVRGPVMAYARG